MTVPISPLAPLPPDPQHRRKAKPEAKTVMHRLMVPMLISTAIGVYIGSVPLLVLGGVVWIGWAVYYILLTQILQPTGSSTPSVAQHSNIEALEARGEYAKAAQAYRSVIESQPQDMVACEKLGQLALRQLKDFELAVWAYRQAEQRSDQPKRQLGYALIIAGIYRDNIGDSGKAIVELRKVLGRYPDAPNADRLRAELEELRSRHFEAP
jgi:cytochrome c-type biogenesis protein CcmH/NrfG